MRQLRVGHQDKDTNSNLNRTEPKYNCVHRLDASARSVNEGIAAQYRIPKVTTINCVLIFLVGA